MKNLNMEKYFVNQSFVNSLPCKAIRSDRSGQMSDCEKIAQVAHVKRATVRDSLRSHFRAIFL